MRVDLGGTAVVSIDLQNQLTKIVLKDQAMLDRVAKVFAGARRAGVPVVHVRVAFLPGYPEIGPNSNSHEKRIKSGGTHIVDGTPEAEIHPKVAPKAGEIVITKRRQGPFAGTDLDPMLRGWGKDTVVLMGIGTSGAILNAVKDGGNRNFQMVVLSDCCCDTDPEVHKMLTEKVFRQNAEVMTSAEFLAALPE